MTWITKFLGRPYRLKGLRTGTPKSQHASLCVAFDALSALTHRPLG